MPRETLPLFTDLTAIEFFAGIGLMRRAMEAADVRVVWANDIERDKHEMYAANFGADEFVLADVRDIHASSLPEAAIATASFPCTDLSLAGNRKGMGDRAAPKGHVWESSMFWEFARLLAELGDNRPPVILLENVTGFATSNQGRDLRQAILTLNGLGYSCDLLAIDARHFVPQSRPRMFIVGATEPPGATDLVASQVRPQWLVNLAAQHPDLRLHGYSLPELPVGPQTLDGFIEVLPEEDDRWWDEHRLRRFLESLSPVQRNRLDQLVRSGVMTWRTAYRRTRGGRAVWEIRADGISGCLRTARGGSSKQAVVEVRDFRVRVRWMTPREYARLQGAPDYLLPGRANQALFGFGDAVCVPVVHWIAENYLVPLARAVRRDVSVAPEPVVCSAVPALV